MSFDLISDLHIHWTIQFNDDFFNPSAPVLAILGDVCDSHQFPAALSLIEKFSEKWDHVLYVLGNHEFYSATLSEEYISRLKIRTGYIGNFHILERDAIAIEDTLFLGCTLWSNMMNNNPNSWLECFSSLNDYQFIRCDKNGKSVNMTPGDSIEWFDKSFRWLEYTLDELTHDKIVVLTHHAPSFQSIARRFKGSFSNGGFANDLDEFIMDRPKIKVWAHGHCHNSSDYNIGSTRIITNPLGYSGELYDKSRSYLPLLVEV